MRKSAAVALITALFGSAAYLLPDTGLMDLDQREQVAGVTGRPTPAAPVAAATAGAVTNGGLILTASPTPLQAEARVFSPSQPLMAVRPAAPSPAAPPPAVTAPSTPTPSEVPTRRLTSSRPADADARQELVKELQRELKRVGCYEGEVNGTWAPSTRKAMSAFTDRVNATLPLDEPDYILLTLVQGHRSQACGQACPSGQGLSEAGKCVPRAILAQSARRSTDKAGTERLEADVTEVAPAAIARKTTGSGRGNGGRNAWSTIVTASPPAGPAQATTPSVPIVAAAPPSAPLPGRMTVGAPLPPDTTAADATKADTAKAEAVRRKAELAAAAAAQRATEIEAARIARAVGGAQARKAQGTAALAQAEAPRQAARKAAEPTTGPTTTVAALDPAPSARKANDDDRDAARKPVVAAPAARRPNTAEEQARRKMQSRPQTAFVLPQLPPARVVVQQPIVVYRAPPPRRLPPPYAVGAATVYVMPAPRPNYAPAPTRWTRSVFDDSNRH